MSAVLAVRDLRITRREGVSRVPIVDGVDFTLARGEALGVCGESGSGKTLTALSIVGLLPTGLEATGHVRFDGNEILGANRQRLREIRGKGIAVVWQDPAAALHPMLTIGTQLTEHAVYQLGLARHAARERAEELLADVRMQDPAAALELLPHQFSGGQRQRIAIAIALVCRPQILIADEPTTALDVTVQAAILELLGELVARHELSLVVITHDLGVISTLTDRLVVMYSGRIVEAGATGDLIRAPRHPYTRALLEALPPTHPHGSMRPIAGTPPSPGAVPDGCPFSPRCRFAVPACRSTRPQLVSIDAERSVACTVDPFAPR